MKYQKRTSARTTIMTLRPGRDSWHLGCSRDWSAAWVAARQRALPFAGTVSPT